MAINSQKLLPGSTFSNLKNDAKNIKKQTDPKLNIYKKVVKIDKLLKNSLLLQTKEQSKKRTELENEKRGKREKELETPKKFKGFQVLKNALPKIGFFDSIKRFILFTFAGWLFTNLFQFLPKLLEFVKILSPVLSWFEKGIGLLLEGIVSFIDLGYKAYDSVRSFAKTIGGEKFAEKFDALSGALNTFLNLALIAAMSAGSLGGFGKGPGKGAGVRPRPGQGGRPRVTTSGGRGVGRPDIRNPLRQRPRVTTGTGGGVGKGLGKVAGKLPFVGPLIDFGIRRFVFKEPLGRAAAGAVGVAAGQSLGGWLGGSLGGIVGSVVPVAGTLLGAGAGALIGNIAGGFIGDWIGTSLYDMIDSGEDSKPKKMSSGGKVSSTRIREKRKENKLKLKKDVPQNIQPGKDVGGEREIEKIYPNPGRKLSDLFSGFSWSGLLFGGKGKDKTKRKDRKKFPNAIKTLLDVADSLGSSGDWIGSLMRASIQVALGQMPDVKSLAKTISGVLRNVSDPAIKGIKSISRELFGFVGGGEVASLTSSLLSAEDTLTLERNIEINLRNKFEDALGVVRKESKKRGVGREEMIEENIKRGKDEPPLYDSPTIEGGMTPGQWGPLLDLIAGKESGGNYEAMYPSTTLKGATKMTIAEVASRATGAVGKYQQLPQYLISRAKAAGLDPNKDLYSPKNQDLIITKVNIEGNRGGRRWLKGEISDDQFMQGLSQEFASLPNAQGKFYYPGQSSSMTPEKIRSALAKVKKGGYSSQDIISKKPKDSYDLKESDVGLGKGYGSAGSKIAGELGRYLKKVLKQGPDFQAVTEHPEHGGVVGGHSPNSYHYSGRAIDIGAWDYEQPKILRAIAEFNKKQGVKPVELLHAKNEPRGHSDHVHVAYQGGGLISPKKPNVPMPDSFAPYNDPRQSSTLAVQPIIIEKMMPIPIDSPIAFPSGGSGVNNSVLPSLMQG